jgi:hypothetical protein
VLSIPAESARRFGSLKLGEVEVTDDLQPLGRRVLTQIVRQFVEPRGILLLKLGEYRDRVAPLLCTAAMIGPRSGPMLQRLSWLGRRLIYAA